MDLKQIEKLMTAMKESGVKRVAFKKEDFEIEIEMESAGFDLGQYTTHLAPSFPKTPAPIEIKEKPSEESSAFPLPKEQQKAGVFVTSPMVGTFYAAPSPGDPPFIKVGDVVSEDTVVCIIEAMKVMNEVKAGIKGKIAEILVGSGDPVEFGTRIFRIEPT